MTERQPVKSQKETPRETPEVIAATEQTLTRAVGQVALEQMTLAVPGEYNPYSTVEANMKDAIIGQPEAIESIMSALNRERFRNPNRPIANLMFLGPTGVGKSETVKELARQLHGDDSSAFLKIDCSSFQHGHTVAALTGSPPGYVGREQEPLLSPDIVEQDKSVILFDEVEKGSKELWDLMLQIMEDGEVLLTSTGNKVSFKRSIIIMTSNLGSKEMMHLLENKQIGFRSQTSEVMRASEVKIDKAAKAALKDYFRPEFINRIDKRIVFKPLNDEQFGEVIDRYVEKANVQYNDAGVELELSPELRQSLIISCDERREMGARPILRLYDNEVESLLSEYINSDAIPEASRVRGVLKAERATEQIAAKHDITKDDIAFYYTPDETLERILSHKREEELRQMREYEQQFMKQHETKRNAMLPFRPPAAPFNIDDKE